MQKMFVVFVALVALAAHADNIVTSREYVDTQAKVLQDALPPKNEDTVLIYGATSEPGNKAIYDASANYIEQTEALVTAGQFNTAVQNALESEFVCIERQNGNGGCLLYEIRGATQQQILPTGYTQLEYIESTGTQWIDTNQALLSHQDLIIETNMQYTEIEPRKYLGGIYAGAYFGIATDNWSIGGKLGTMSATITADTTKHNFRMIAPNMGTTQTLSLIIDNSVTITNYRSSTTGEVFIFTVNIPEPNNAANNASKSRLYDYFKIYVDTHLTFNGIPARRDSDGELGMHDLVSGTFFTNAGSGEFIAGPVVGSNLYLPSGN